MTFEDIISVLGIPYFKNSRCAIYKGDSLKLLSYIPNNSLDLVFTSPPYNIGKCYEDIMPLDVYINWCVNWIKLVYATIKHDGAFLLNVGYISVPDIGHALPISYLLWDKIPFYLQQEIVWNYGAGVACKKYLSPRNEKIMWYVKDKNNYCFNLDAIRDPNVLYPNQKKRGKLRTNTLGKNPSDVWQIAKVTSGANRASKERTSHPAQLPLDVCDRVIKGFSNKNAIILDPFLGSGSVMDSAIANGRFAIGFEINEEYCQLASDRILNKYGG